MKTITVEAAKNIITNIVPRIALCLCLTAMLLVPCGLMAAGSTVTYGVGACGQVGVTSFATISEALAATPTPDVVKICPGTYPEQVVIKTPLTLEGIVANGEGQVFINVPAGGLKVNATSESGFPVAAEVFVDNVSGPVEISDIGVDGSGNGIASSSTTDIAGIYYQNSSGTVDHVETRYQEGNQLGIGIWAESGSAAATVTVEYSNAHDIDYAGILMEGYSAELTATIDGNSLSACKSATLFYGSCIMVDGKAAVTISGNLVNGQGVAYSSGIFTGQGLSGGTPTGSISSNIISYTGTGINVNAGNVSVTSNKLYDILGYAIYIFNPVTVQDNTIMQAQYGINFECQTANGVSANTLVAIHSIGIDQVPTSVTSTNAYFNVPTIRSAGVCE
jgi:hypothetical protein